MEQVAAAAGVPPQKIERFAYPVLLERSRTAELAQRAHPVRADGPDARTLGDVVAHTFGLRGQEYTEAEWDSWKGEDGKWVVALSWRAGRSDNRAHWTFHPGAHGGTVTALDEHASDLVEGLPARPLRTVGPVIDIARQEEDRRRRGTAGGAARRRVRHRVRRRADRGWTPAGTGSRPARAGPSSAPVTAGPAQAEPRSEPRAADPAATDRRAADTRATERDPTPGPPSPRRPSAHGEAPPVDPRAGQGAPGDATSAPPSRRRTPPRPTRRPPRTRPRTPPAPANRRTKKGKPVMPSWDEVLLGVRGQR